MLIGQTMEFQYFQSNVPDGTQPSITSLGTSVPPSASANTYGSAVELMTLDHDCHFITINLTSSGQSVRRLLKICSDVAGNDVIIPPLLCGNVSTSLLGGHTFKFPLSIPRGTTLYAFSKSSSASSDTLYCHVEVVGNPTHEGVLRTGSVIDTYGLDEANTKSFYYWNGIYSGNPIMTADYTFTQIGISPVGPTPGQSRTTVISPQELTGISASPFCGLEWCAASDSYQTHIVNLSQMFSWYDYVPSGAYNRFTQTGAMYFYFIMYCVR
jgi:hypothetical protein